MIAPLMVLAVLSIIGGWVGVPKSMFGHNEIGNFLKPVMTASVVTEHAGEAAASETPGEEPKENRNEELILAGTSVLVALIGWYFARLLYLKRPELPEKITAKIHGIYLLVLHKYYVDEGYGQLIVKPLLALSTVVLWKGVDQGVIDGMVNGAGSASKGIGGELRRIQSGNIRSYAAWVAIGGAAVIAYMIWIGVAK